MRRVILMGVFGAAFILGSAAIVGGAYIHLKAHVAQHLIARAWTRIDSLDEISAINFSGQAKPWPWADTHAVARLRVPSLGIDQYVLAGAHGQALAFGPGHVSHSAKFDGVGYGNRNSVIAGHRDSHFRFLQYLQIGEQIFIDLPGGRRVVYRVDDAFVTDEFDSGPLAPSSLQTLTLITCYPFDAIRPGGPLRYVVTATL